MPTVINTNLASLFAQNSLSNAQNNLAQSVQRLSSGLRINSAKDDAAGLSISQSMQSQINGTNQSIRNLSDATNLLQVADSSLSTVQDMLLRMKQLTTQGYDGALSASQKLNIMQELIDLNNEINATAQRTQFNGINLLTSGASLDSVNTDVKQGATLVNSAVKVSTASGLGASTTLADAGNTIYNISLDNAKSAKIPGTYTLSASGNNLTLTGSFGGKDQSQTIALASMVGYDPAVTQQAKVINSNANFDNFGISINLTSSIAAGTTETGAQLASAIVARSNTIQVDGKSGQISNVSLRGANPGTYQLSFENTGSVSNLSLPASTVSGQVVAGTARNVALVGGSGSGATADIVYNGSGQITGLTVNAAGTGYKAGDVFTTAAITQGTVIAPTITTAEGAGAATESARVTFAALGAGEVMTLAGLTYTAGSSGASAAQVANAFSNLNNGAVTGAGTLSINGSGSYAGNFNGYTTGAASGNAVQFTSTQANTSVTDLVAGPASQRPIVLTTEGAATVNETASVRFQALQAGKSIQLAGLTFTAGSVDLTADQVAYAFMGLSVNMGTNNAATTAAVATASTARGGALSGDTGTFTAGTLAGFKTTGALRTTGAVPNDTLVFTSFGDGNVTDLAAVGTPALVTTQGGTGGVTEQADAKFSAGLNANQIMTIGGLTFTAGSANITAAQLAAAFANLSNGATTGAGTTYGSYSGALAGYSTGAPTGTSSDTVRFTSASANTNVTDLISNPNGTAPTITVTQGTASVTESATVSFGTALTAGQTMTLGGLTFTSGGATTQEQLAAAFSNLQSGTTGASLNASGQSALGTFSGTFNGYNTSIVGAGSRVVTFTSTTPNTNVTDLASAVSGTAPTFAVVQGQGNGSESTVATFVALASGQSLTVGGLTITATAARTDAEVAAAFANLANGATTGAGANVTYSGQLAGFSTGAVSTADVTFTSATLGSNVTDLTASVSNAPAVTVINQGSTGASESARVTFSALAAGQFITLGGLTYTALQARTAAQVATAFASIAAGATPTSDSNGTYTGALTGFSSTTVSNTNDVVFSSAAVLEKSFTFVSTTDDGDGTADTITIAGRTITITGSGTAGGSLQATAQDIADAFATGVTTGNASVSGTLDAGVVATRVGANKVVFTNPTASISALTETVTDTAASITEAVRTGNVANLAAPISGSATIVVTQQGGATSSTETAAISFNAANMAAGDSVTLAGLTFTAGVNGATQSQVAAAFSNLAAGTSSANLSSANGTFSGTLTGWSTGASNGSGLTATSSTASQDVTNMTASATQRSALNALSGIVVGGLANQTGENLLTLRGTVNGNLETSQIKLKDNAANSSQILDFSKFGIQFTVDSFQAQSASDIGAALASLNSSSPSYGSSGAFKPGQIVVSNGANSALKFQSGADSEAFIQIDTLNIQTGKTGATAGSDATMMAVGDAIAGTATGNLGGLGVNDSINSWQTAFRNASAAVDAAIDNISSKRATFGSQMSRLGFITTNLTAQSTNLQNSRSAIIDTDFASETAKLTKGQIMQQAATAMLAQANQMPNVILSLLK